MGVEGTFAPPPPKIGKKKKRCSNFAIFPYLVVTNAKFSWLASLASVIQHYYQYYTLIKNLENITCSYILPLFYMSATVASREGNFDMKIQDFWALKSLNCRSFRGHCPPPPGPPPGLRPGPDWGPKRSPDPSPSFALSNPKT